MKTSLIFTLLLSFCLGTTLWAQKKPAKKPAKQAVSRSGFYSEPYRSRNIGSFYKQAHLVSLTYGFPNTLDYADFLFGGSSSGVGPVNLRYEFPVRDEVSAGLALGAAHKKWDFGDGTQTKVTGFSISPLGFYHFNKLIPVKELDVYAGVGANVNYISYKYNDDLVDDDTDVEVYPTGLVGARYYFTNSLSALLEVGGSSYSVVKIGLSVRI